MARTGQELILTENTAVCRGRLLEAARGPAPHQPRHPQVHFTLESSDTGWRVRAQGGTLDGGGREAACGSRPDGGGKGFWLQPGSSRRPFSFDNS